MKLSILGRAIPFKDPVVVPLDLKVVMNLTYYTGISALDGQFFMEYRSRSEPSIYKITYSLSFDVKGI